MARKSATQRMHQGSTRIIWSDGTERVVKAQTTWFGLARTVSGCLGAAAYWLRRERELSDGSRIVRLVCMVDKLPADGRTGLERVWTHEIVPPSAEGAASEEPHEAARAPDDELREAEQYIAALRGPLLHYFGTTDPELLAEVWADQAKPVTP